MYSQTLYPKTKQVLGKILKAGILNNFYLAGGTALALQIGHRKSIDLDFFSDKFPKRDLLLQKLKPLNPKLTQEAPGTLDLLIGGVKVSFLEYNYPLVSHLQNFEKIKLASITDIACMKLTAVSSRGSKKDFIDLYFILQKLPLEELLKKFELKYKGVDYQKLHIFKSLTYFNDAENDPDPDYLNKIDWDVVKRSLEKEVKRYLENL